MSLRDKTLTGIFWSASEIFLKYGVTFVIGIILARLLGPKEYGLIAMATIFTGILGFISEGCLANALIRKQNPNDDDYNTVFFVNMLLSVTLIILLIVLAPFFARFLENDTLTAAENAEQTRTLTNVIRAMSATIFLGAFAVVHKAILTKRIDFKSQSIITTTSYLLGGVVGIVMAYKGFKVWAIVGQQITLYFIRSVLFQLYSRWWPRFSFSRESFKEIFAFSWKLLVSGLITRIYLKFENFIIAKFYSSTDVGAYNKAANFPELISDNVTNIVERVSFPILSEIQDDNEKLRDSYRKIIRMTMFSNCIFLGWLAACANAMVAVLLGQNWMMIVPFLMMICLRNTLNPLQALNLNMLQVKGRTDLLLLVETLKNVFSVVPLFIGALFSIKMMIVAGIFNGIICFFIYAHFSNKLLGYSCWQQIRDIIPGYLIGGAVCLIIWPLNLLEWNCFYLFPVQGLCCIILTLVICMIFKPNDYLEIKSIIISKISRK